MPQGVLLTDEEFERWANKYLDLQIEFGFVLESERESEMAWILENFRDHKPYVRIN